MTDYLNAVECHTAFVGSSSIPDNLKPEDVILPKHDGNLSENPHGSNWIEAMAEEMDVLEKRKCWEWQDRSVAEANPNFARSKPIPAFGFTRPKLMTKVWSTDSVLVS